MAAEDSGLQTASSLAPESSEVAVVPAPALPSGMSSSEGTEPASSGEPTLEVVSSESAAALGDTAARVADTASAVAAAAAAVPEGTEAALGPPPEQEDKLVVFARHEAELAAAPAEDDYEDAHTDKAPADAIVDLSDANWSEVPGVQSVEIEKPALDGSLQTAGTIGGPLAIAPGASGQSGTLNGLIVYVSPGHGFLHYTSSPYWRTQRGISQDLIEDFANNDQMNHFVQYIFNAGATVVPTRPVGNQPNQVIIDNVSASVTWTGTWSNSSSTVYYGAAGQTPYRYASTTTSGETAVARYTPTISVAGDYPVYCWTRAGSDRVPQLYRIVYAGGMSEVRVDHRKVGDGFVYLGTYYFEAGTGGYAEISNNSPSVSGVIIADAIVFGNGMGNYNAGYGVSGYERELEGALYWVRFARGQGQTDLFSYGDVGVRPRYAALMNRETYGAFSDRVFISFHSNAGGGSARGAIGLWNNASLFPGTKSPYQREYGYALALDTQQDALALGVPPLEVAWYNRGSTISNLTYARTDYAFGEINYASVNNEMEITINEVAFHDNTEDGKLLRDPQVRNAIGRANYQGLVKFLNQYYSKPSDLLPDPPTHARAKNNGNGTVTVSWAAPVVDSAGGQAATGYVVYRSTNGRGFGNPITIAGGGNLSTTISGLTAGQVYYFRVAATNTGGQSMPSEVVAVRLQSSGSTPILIVNGYDRLDRYIMPRRAIGHNINNQLSTFVEPQKANACNYVIQHGKAIAAAGQYFDSCSNEAVEGGQISLSGYSCVVWIGGQQASISPLVFPAFSSTLRTAMQNYLNGGGRLFVSGSEIAWDMDRDTDQTDPNSVFIQSYLKADYMFDNAYEGGTLSNKINGVSGSIFNGLSNITFDAGTGGIYKVGYPDVIAANGGSTVAMSYVDSTKANPYAAIQYDGATFKVVYLAFPFETILTEANRNTVMQRALDFLLASAPTPSPTPSPSPSPSPSPTPSPSPSPTPSPSPSPTPSPSPSPSPTPSPTPSLTPSPTPSPSPTPQTDRTDVIVDNDQGSPAYTETGTWTTSGSAGYNGGTYRFATVGGAHTATWTATVGSGDYTVSVWYVAGTNRATSTKYTISTATGNQTVYINQTQNSQTWVSLGTFRFNGGSATVTLDAAGSTGGSVVIADPVRFQYQGPTIIDDDWATPGFTKTGTWTRSTTSGYNGGGYWWANTAQSHTSTWNLKLPKAGNWRISVIYRAGTNRPTAAKYVVATASGNQTVYVDQTLNNLTWVTLGTWNFNVDGGVVTLDALGSTPSGKAVIADTVRAELIP